MTIFQIAALAYVFIYFVVIIGFRSYLLYKKTGVNSLGKFGRKGLIGYNERILSAASLLIPIVAFNYALLPQNYKFLVPIHFLETMFLQNMGMLLCAVGFLIAIIAQLQMKEDWRIGIDPKQHTKLVTNGFYRYSRNPIYLGIIISFAGFFFLMPSALNLCFLALMLPAIGVKVRLEEQYLLAEHPEHFKKYKEQVRRWI